MIRRIAQALVFVLAFLIIVAEIQSADDAAAACAAAFYGARP
ncbi:hypothetical protein [Massilia sp.]|nr:hypothetical protein [Massilia sp.]